MPKYRFDNIREAVLKWNPENWKKITIDQVRMVPDNVFLGWFDLGEYIPLQDCYGEVIEDINDWAYQREEYIKELVKEIKRNKWWKKK